MRVVFMGTPAFAVPPFEALHGSREHEVAAVYTQPDRPSGRGREPSPSAVKERAVALGVPVMQPESLRDPGVAEGLAGLAPDVVCVAAYGKILPPEVLAVPPDGCVNIHASLLPRHRGAAPVHHAILAGDEHTGISIMAMEEGMDTGPVAATAEVSVGEHTADSLTETLAAVGARLLLEVLAAVDDRSVLWVPQDDTRATYAPPITKDDVGLAPELSVADAARRVRASTRSAPCRLHLPSVVATVLEARPSMLTVPPGKVYTTSGLCLGFADGALELLELRPDSRKAMSGDAFVRGLKPDVGDDWRAA
jgi:methionyl-tRNA formyltransferase